MANHQYQPQNLPPVQSQTPKTSQFTPEPVVQSQPKEGRSPKTLPPWKPTYQDSQAVMDRMFGMPVQAKLAVGEPQDRHEQQADQVAAQVVQQLGTSEPITPLPIVAQTVQPQTIQRTPEDVWNQVDQFSQLTHENIKFILEQHFYSNWFLAQEYLLDPQKWVKRHHKTEGEATAKLPNFKKIMKTLLTLRQHETEGLLEIVLGELKTKRQYRGLEDKDILAWGSAGSQSLTSDIDVNLKGAGSIEAVGLFNQYFKTMLGWSLDPGTVYDVNVYAQDFMTPGQGGKPFVKDAAKNTLTPVQESDELNSPEQVNALEFTGFDAFALNQDVWSMLKMRLYMNELEWIEYCVDLRHNLEGDQSEDGIARGLQLEEQIQDTETQYRNYQEALKNKIEQIDHSTDEIYQDMKKTLEAGSQYLHDDHKAEASKKMIASNLIYQEKLQQVSELRSRLQNMQAFQHIATSEVTPAMVKDIAIQLKNALSEAILYSNEAYFTQGAVHFAVIGQQIGGGKSDLIMSDDEHLHSFREQVGDTLKVLNEYKDASIDKAILKAGKYIDRLAKSAKPLLTDNPPRGYDELAHLGATAAKLKSDKTKREDLQDKGQDNLNPEETQKLQGLQQSIPVEEQEFKAVAGAIFANVSELREVVVTVGREVEKGFRQKQIAKNTANPSVAPEADPQLNQVQAHIQSADQGLGKLNQQINQ